MTKMLTLTSPQHILCQFPNKFALFPQQNCFISPTHFLISPATLCHFAPHQKTMIFFGNFIWGFISQHHWITLTKAKTFRGFKSHRCFKLVIQNEDLALPSWHIWSSSYFVLRRIFLCWFHRQYHWTWPGDRQLDLSHQDLTWCSCRQEMRKRNPVFTCRRLGLLYLWQYFLQHIALQRSRSSLERLSVRRRRWSVMQRWSSWTSTTAHFPLISCSPPAHLTTLSFP